VGIIAACAAPAEEESAGAAQAATETERATSALRALGAKVGGASTQCQRCHDVNQATVRRWGSDFARTLGTLTNPAMTREQRRASLRLDPSDPSSGYSPHRLGLVAAAAYLEPSAAEGATSRALASALADVFPEASEREAFRRAVRMPANESFAALSPTEVEAVTSWAKEGMPKLAESLPEGERPATCREDLLAMREHVRAMRTRNWAAVNRDAQLRMFACDPGAASPRQCFQQSFQGAPRFPEAKDTRFGRSWSADGSTMRVLRSLDFYTYFWLRTSADGRFVANGLSRRGKDGGVISDLQAALDPGGPRTRDIYVDAKYDPDFWPDNRGFMYQGTADGATYCPQSLLEDPGTQAISFKEASCSKLGVLKLYQTVGLPTTGDDAIAQRLIVNSTYINDNGGNGQALEMPLFGADATITVQTMSPRSNDPADGYAISRSETLAAPFEGDTMVSRSGTVLASRIAGRAGPLGYAFRRLDASTSPPTATPMGTLCLEGSKANFSYDERFLVTHQYRVSRNADLPGGSDVWLVDLLTGEKVRITKTGEGQFALYPHFRSDGWLMFLVREGSKSWVVASDAALRRAEATP
jgi:hypothetical protein